MISVAKMKNCEEPKNAAISIIKRRGKITAFSDGAKNSDYSTGEKAAKNLTLTHCSKSSFFVQKFNFDFPRKQSIFFE